MFVCLPRVCVFVLCICLLIAQFTCLSESLIFKPTITQRTARRHTTDVMFTVSVLVISLAFKSFVFSFVITPT